MSQAGTGVNGQNPYCIFNQVYWSLGTHWGWDAGTVTNKFILASNFLQNIFNYKLTNPS